LPLLFELWHREVTEGRQDAVPNETRLRRMLSRFDWEAKSRMVDEDGRITGAVLVMSRPSPIGIIANVHVAGAPEVASDLAQWGVRLSRAAGARTAQTYMARGQGRGLREAGLEVVRPWWRMDRSLDHELPDLKPVAGYDLVDALTVAPGSWSEMFNRTFADHWRFVPRGEEEIVADRPPELCLMAVWSVDRSPAAIALGELEDYGDDPRAQPVGLISSVGTLPEHRRRGLAGWLVAALMHRIRKAGARSASLYVDGLNPMRAYDVYRKLGFEVKFEAEVWEATFP
jgi:ribosomal protein S18 acetylase RimI-like enzyme